MKAERLKVGDAYAVGNRNNPEGVRRGVLDSPDRWRVPNWSYYERGSPRVDPYGSHRRFEVTWSTWDEKTKTEARFYTLGGVICPWAEWEEREAKRAERINEAFRQLEGLLKEREGMP